MDALAAPADELASLPGESELQAAINDALAARDPKAIVEALRSRGMSRVARETGLVREGFYRAFSADGKPEFTT
ncbi:hypothetical protein [Bradyrhizobium sp. WSM2793]|uniref:helix-turn-helix domain-containing transcriptional regulator n=1 Tax=Bradyrhizobium sp. WSM2793 TaxID=1038866 RepID=UPI0009FD235E